MIDKPAQLIEKIPAIQDGEDLRCALWEEDPQFIQRTEGEDRVAAAKALSWDEFHLRHESDDSSRRAALLETVNNTTLAVIGIDGEVYQLGDRIQFETTRKKSGWGVSRTKHSYTAENQIDHLTRYNLSISRLPTYSNVPSESPSATPGSDDIKIVERSGLSDYRTRLTEGTDLNIPEAVNGWSLTSVDSRSKPEEEAILPTDIVTDIEWSNGENSSIRAHWRGSYNCWYLSTPVDGTVCSENEDRYLYEIDIPQQTVRTDEIIAFATAAMDELDPDSFQSPYDLRDSEVAEEPRNLSAEFVPTDIPSTLGDWTIDERRHNEIRWVNTNETSVWGDFSVKFDFQGGVTVKNERTRDIHDRRLVEKHMPSGKPFDANIDAEYEWRRRDMWDENWHYGVAFLVQTSKSQPDTDSIDRLENQIKETERLEEIEHGLSCDPHETLDRTNETLLAY